MQLTQFHVWIKRHLPILTQAAATIVDQDVSNYPVFVSYQAEDEVGLGVRLINSGTDHEHWAINASTLEELVTKQVIASHKVDDFRTLYKSHPDDLCVLTWQEGVARFVFIPAT